jgi:hypothetical protein
MMYDGRPFLAIGRKETVQGGKNWKLDWTGLRPLCMHQLRCGRENLQLK